MVRKFAFFKIKNRFLEITVRAIYVKVSEYLFLHEIKKYWFFLHKTIEKPYLNLHFKFHDFFPENNEDMKILSFGLFFLPNINQFSLVSL